MNILFGIPYKEHLEIALSEVEAFRNLGAEVEVSDYSNSGKVTGTFNSLILVLKNAIAIKRKVIKRKIEIVYLNTSLDRKTLIRDSISIFIIKLFNNKTKVVLKVHGSEETIVKASSSLKRYVFRRADIFLLLSNEEKANFLRAGLESKKALITANPIHIASYKPDPEFKENLGISKKAIVLLFVGRLMETKGILDLVEACKLLKKHQMDYTLFCLGSGPLEPVLKQMVGEYELPIKLTGYIPEDDTKYYYSNCDIMILPTYHSEGFPMAVFRAVAAGKAVITTQIRAAADYLKENENCLWVNKQDPVDLYNKIVVLAENETLRLNMGLNNLSLAKEFTAEKIARNFMELYAAAVNT
jgi:glycosyltransferase involved in cell wall biosynthesis